MTWLLPAVIFTLASSLVLFVVYAYLFQQERQKFLGIWTWSWGIYSARFALLLLILLWTRHPALLIGNQLCSLWSGYLLLYGVYVFSGRTMSRWWLLGAAGGTAWVIAATSLKLPFLWLSLPTFMFMAMVSIWAGAAFLRDNKISGLGKYAAGAALIVWGLHKANYPFLRPVEWFAPWGYLLGALFGLVTALATLLVYFQKNWDDLAKSEDRYRRIVDTANEGVWEVDQDHSTTFVNQKMANMLGYEPREMVGRRLEDFICQEDTEEFRLSMNKRRRGQSESYERRYLHKSGKPIWVLVNATPILDDKGNFAGSFGMFTDITERKQAEKERAQMEAQLAQAQKMDALGILASGIAHDFNNLLAAIMGYSELVLEDIPKGRQTRSFVEGIIKASSRAKELVRQILTFSRKAQTNKAPMSLNSAVNEALSMLERTIPKMIRFECDLDQELKPVNADAQQMEQIILNLVGNAADAMQDSGAIFISTRNIWIDERTCEICGKLFSGEYAMLSVKDNGSGMSPATKAKIFDPFFTTKGVGKGTGLGLSTVYGIVTSHDGHISCDSIQGVGTEFTVYLPFAAPAARQAGEPARLAANALHGRETIMVVDDEAVLREIASKLLTKCGYKVLQAGSGEQALKLYGEDPGRIDGIIMDLGMPGMGGKACLPCIRRIDPQAKVLIASGYIRYELSKELISLGAAGMVAKPYRKDELLVKLREVLDG